MPDNRVVFVATAIAVTVFSFRAVGYVPAHALCSVDSGRSCEPDADAEADKPSEGKRPGAEAGGDVLVAFSQRSFSSYPYRTGNAPGSQALADWKQRIPLTASLAKQSTIPAVELSTGMILHEFQRQANSQSPSDSAKTIEFLKELEKSMQDRKHGARIVNLSVDNLVFRMQSDKVESLWPKLDIWIDFAAMIGAPTISLPVDHSDAELAEATVKSFAKNLSTIGEHVSARSDGRVRLLIENWTIQSFRQMETFGDVVAETKRIQGGVPEGHRIGVVIAVRLLKYRLSDAIDDFLKRSCPVGQAPTGQTLVGLRAASWGFGSDDAQRKVRESSEYRQVISALRSSNCDESANGRLPKFLSVECLGVTELRASTSNDPIELARPGIGDAYLFFNSALAVQK